MDSSKLGNESLSSLFLMGLGFNFILLSRPTAAVFSLLFTLVSFFSDFRLENSLLIARKFLLFLVPSLASLLVMISLEIHKEILPLLNHLRVFDTDNYDVWNGYLNYFDSLRFGVVPYVRELLIYNLIFVIFLMLGCISIKSLSIAYTFSNSSISITLAFNIILTLMLFDHPSEFNRFSLLCLLFLAIFYYKHRKQKKFSWPTFIAPFTLVFAYGSHSNVGGVWPKSSASAGILIVFSLIALLSTLGLRNLFPTLSAILALLSITIVSASRLTADIYQELPWQKSYHYSNFTGLGPLYLDQALWFELDSTQVALQSFDFKEDDNLLFDLSGFHFPLLVYLTQSRVPKFIIPFEPTSSNFLKVLESSIKAETARSHAFFDETWLLLPKDTLDESTHSPSNLQLQKLGFLFPNCYQGVFQSNQFQIWRPNYSNCA